MFLIEKLEILTNLMKNEDIDALMIGPSSDLEYFTGLNPMSDERFKALIILKDKRYFYICPELYYEETRELLGEDAHIFIWSDTDGFLKAIKEAANYYNLKNIKIGVNDAIRAIDILEIENAIKAKFFIGSGIIENVRIIKDEEEKSNLRKSAHIADEVAGEIIKFIRPGLTERDIKRKIEELFMEKGVQSLAFETIVASGPNSSKPHYNGDSRVIEEQDIIVLDFGCKYNGYCSDISRTVFVGEPTEEQKKIYDIVVKANTAAESFVKQGVTAEDVDKMARDVIKQAGYGQYFLNRTGHGIGRAVHEGPYIREGNKQVLENGMAFSIEPGIYLPGQYGMRVEDIVLIDNWSGEVLNKFIKDLIII